MSIYENIGGEWKTLSMARSLAVVYNRYQGQRSVIEPLIKAKYPNQTWETTQQVIFGFYLTNLQGSNTVEFDNTKLVPEANDILDALQALNSLRLVLRRRGAAGRRHQRIADCGRQPV